MRELTRTGLMPGVSVLGGAAAGFSYEGALRDAMARRELARQMAAGQANTQPPQQTQTARSERAAAQAQRQQG